MHELEIKYFQLVEAFFHYSHLLFKMWAYWYATLGILKQGIVVKINVNIINSIENTDLLT